MVQMPAMNTPQFGWVKSRLPRKGQPVPPIYQPEVAARAIIWAASHNRCEIYVGWPTVEAIVGNKIAPGWLDAYLARTCYEAQMTDQPEDPRRPDNLWQPVPGDHGAHGTFDCRSRSSSWQLWADLHRDWLAAAGGARGAGVRAMGYSEANRAKRRAGISSSGRRWPVAHRGQVGWPRGVHRLVLTCGVERSDLAGRVAQGVEQFKLRPVILGHRREVFFANARIKSAARKSPPGGGDQHQLVAESAGL